MPRRTQQEARETRRRILDTAIRHCEQRGYEQLALADVAREAGVTRGAIYHHFANKQALFLEMVETLLLGMGAAILEAAGKAPNTWQSLLAGCRAFLSASQDKTYQAIILNQAPAVLGTARWNALDQIHTTQSLIEVLGDLQTGGVIAVADIHATAEALSGAMNQLSRWVADGHRLETAWETLMQFLDALLVSGAMAPNQRSNRGTALDKG